MKKYTFRYGDTHVTAEIDPSQVLGELHGHSVPAIKDIRKAVFDALDNPVGARPLKELVSEQDTIAFIISDMSRFWMRQDLVIPHMVDYLHDVCHVPDSHITIVVANGTHIGGDEQELRTLVTDKVFDRIRVINHDSTSPSLKYIGTTAHGTDVVINSTVAEADFVLTLGAVTHHVMAGFGGGRKSILPGVSSMETIKHNHAFSLSPTEFRSNPLIGNGKLEGNPLNEDMCEAAALIPRLFVVNLMMNAEMKLAKINAGDCMKSWLEGCEFVNNVYRTPIKEKADVIITSCGGYPKDMSLYQGTKAIDNVESGLKQGGTLILIIEAREGGGPEEYFGWCKNLTDGTIEHRLRHDFTIPGYIFFLNCEQAQRYRIMLLTKIPPETTAPMGIESYSDMDTLLRNANLQGKSIYIIENGSTVIPEVEK